MKKPFYQMLTSLIDNQASNVKCYLPEYTLIEKPQTISTKYRVNKQKNIASPVNFIRHYYDVYKLLSTERIQKFMQTTEYQNYKVEKFGILDEPDLTNNPAFQLSIQGEMDKFSALYQKKTEIYFDETPSFEEIIETIKSNAGCL